MIEQQNQATTSTSSSSSKSNNQDFGIFDAPTTRKSNKKEEDWGL